MRGRSQCDGCGRTLAPLELVPILSWAALKGRCRSCGGRIDPRQPAMEIAAALVGVAAAVAHPWPLAAVTALFGWWLLLVAALDAEHMWLPDALTLIPAGLLAALAGFGPELEARAIGAAAGYAALALIAAGYKRLRGRDGLGGGDPKLFAAIGAWLGWEMLPTVLVGAGLAGFALLAVRAARGERAGAADRLPLGSLMAIPAWAIWLILAA